MNTPHNKACLRRNRPDNPLPYPTRNTDFRLSFPEHGASRRQPSISLLSLLLLAALTAQAQSLIREAQTITIDNTPEVWRLVWKSPPKPSCEPGNAEWYTCPCNGFAFGESGSIDLVRLRQGREVDRLSLDPFFRDDGMARPGRATIQRTATIPKDMDDPEGAALPAQVAKRPPVRLMNFADYDHDGHATEFYLQTSTGPCGHTWGVVIGISTSNPKLHAFGTALHPNTPLQLDPSEWKALLKSPSQTRVIDWPCGDHGDNKQTELLLQPTPLGIFVTREVFVCPRRDTSRPTKREAQ